MRYEWSGEGVIVGSEILSHLVYMWLGRQSDPTK